MAIVHTLRYDYRLAVEAIANKTGTTPGLREVFYVGRDLRRVRSGH
jgi:hypothetical protein